MLMPVTGRGHPCFVLDVTCSSLDVELAHARGSPAP